jgi:hypothetical protein
VLEFFGSLKMQSDKAPYYTHASDINAILCGDGISLGHGYAFIFAGWGNSKTAILRDGEIVAETTEALLPDVNSRDFWKGWFRIRAEKLGDSVRLWVGGEPVLEFTDADPLPGGRVGLWTYRNGLMVARARLWYAHEKPGGVVREAARKVEPPPSGEHSRAAAEFVDDFERDRGEWHVPPGDSSTLLELDDETAAAGRQSLRVTNGGEGGLFAAEAVAAPFRVTDWPRLSFDYRLSRDVRVNLYLYALGRWRAVAFTADEVMGEDTRPIGRIADVRADGAWHHAEVDLPGLLEPLRRGPGGSPGNRYLALYCGQAPGADLTISRVALSAPTESYLRCGIGGNGCGACYWLDNFRIGPPQ